MNIKNEYIPLTINIKNTDKCKISRCIYHFQGSLVDTYCLIRIFEFPSKTIVIASQILGITRGDNLLIENIIEQFELDYKNLYWINHDGSFSCFKSVEEEFLHTVFSYEKDSFFSHRKIYIKELNRITKKSVETLIETSLEPVELWLGLDLIAENRFIRAREEKTFELLYYYLKENIEYLYARKEIIEILTQSYPGAIFFYPKENKKIEFISYTELSHNNDFCSNKVMTYIKKSFLDEEIVICINIDNYDPFCTILCKDFFLNPTRTNFPSIEKLVKYEIESLDIVEFDVERYREKIRVGKERLESLLQLYLEPKFDHLKSIFEQMESERSKLKNSIGALFYYPEDHLCFFSFRWELTSMSKRLAIPYVDTYNVETEIVICFSIYSKDSLSVCGIFPR